MKIAKDVRIVLTLAALGIVPLLLRAHGPSEKKDALSDGRASFTPLLQRALSDSALAGYQVQITEMRLAPGWTDTKAHRHDADLFVYVEQGTVETSFNEDKPLTFKAGHIFHEPRNILHAMMRNPSVTEPAKLMLIYIIKEGRAHYTPEPAKK